MDTKEHEGKKNFLTNNWQWIVNLGLFIAFAVTLVYNTWPKEHPELQELLNGLKQQTPAVAGTHVVKQETTTNREVPICDIWGRIITPSVTTKEISSTTKTSDLPESYVITKEDMEKALTTVAYAARKEALSEYKQNFSILLTILTIFGIAWPVIIALLQFRFNEKELKKIQEANNTAQRTKEQMNNLEGRMNDIFNGQLNAHNAIQQFQLEMEKIQKDFYEEISLVYGGLGTAFTVFSNQNNQKDLFIPGILLMFFRQLKYSCKSGKNIDEEVELILETFKDNKTLFEGENRILLNESWKNLDEEFLKSNCSKEQFNSLKEMCSIKNNDNSGASK